MPDLASPPSRRMRLAIAVPLLLAVLAYARVLHGEFQFDDRTSIEQNALVKSLPRFLAGASWGGAARPLTDLTFALNYAAGRLDPFGYHLVNLVLHLVVVLLLHRLTLAVAGRAGSESAEALAVAVAGLFAVHPLMSQAVSYVAQRAESLSSLLYVASLLLLLQAERRGRTAPGAAAWAGALLLFVLAFKAKAIAVTMPAAWLLLAVALPREEGVPPLRRAGRALAPAWPFLAAAALLGWSAVAGLGGSHDAGFGVSGLRPGSYFLTQLRVVVRYLSLLLWPAGQNLDPDVPLSTGLGAPELAAGGLLVGLIGAAVLLLARSGAWPAGRRAAARLAAFGVLWFFLLLAPTSSVVPIADVMQEHRAYLASWGLILAACAGGMLLLGRVPPRLRLPAGVAAVAVLWIALAVTLHQRNAVWQSRLSLWTDVAAKSPGKVRSHMNLGHALGEAGALEPALAAYGRALALPPDEGAGRAEIRRNLAAALLEAGRLADAARVLQDALAESPWNAELLNNLAICQLDLGQSKEAEATARRALRVEPGQGQALNTLGEALLAQGDAEGALREFLRAAAADPDVAVRHHNVAVALGQLGRKEEACAAVRRALEAERRPLARETSAALGRELGCER